MAPGFKCIEGRAGESDALETARTKADFPPSCWSGPKCCWATTAATGYLGAGFG